MVRTEYPHADAVKLSIHTIHNCVHLIKMELDLADLPEQQGLVKENFKYADLISAVDSMQRSLEDLRVQLENKVVALKNPE
jgi:hypothetical protein